MSQQTLDRRIRRAKQKKIDDMKYDLGYIRCEEEDCGRTDGWLDCSHDLSVQKCKDRRIVEMAYDVNNITIRCRECHQKYDNLRLQWGGT